MLLLDKVILCVRVLLCESFFKSLFSKILMLSTSSIKINLPKGCKVFDSDGVSGPYCIGCSSFY